MSASNPDWSEMWVWRAPGRRAETARMAILTADHLFVTGPLDRRRIADLHEAARLGSDHIDTVLERTDSLADSVKLNRSAITAVSWHRTTRVIEIERVGDDPLVLHCTESASTEEIGRSLQRELAPSELPISAPIDRTKLILFELREGKGRLPLVAFVSAGLAAIVCFAIGAFWLGFLAAAVAAVAAVGVASVFRDADLSVPYYRVDLEVDEGAAVTEADLDLTDTDDIDDIDDDTADAEAPSRSPPGTGR